MNYKNTRIACYTGFVTQAIVVNLAPLLFVIFQRSFDFSIGFIAAVTLITFLIQMAIDAVAIYFVEKTSYRLLAVSSQLTSAVGLVMLAVLPAIAEPHFAIIVSVLVYSTGSGLCEVVLSPLIEAIPAPENERCSSMTLLHSFYAWGQAAVILITTVVLYFLNDDSLWWIIPLIWAVIPLYNGIVFCVVPLADMTVHNEGQGVSKILRSPAFIVTFILMICAGASEQAMAQWASFFCEKGLGVSKIAGDILGPCTFALMMGIGRTAHGLFGGKLNMGRILKILSGFTVVCYITIVFSPSSVPVLSLVFCGLCGLGVSILWPGMLAHCSSQNPGAGAGMFALLALGGDIGCSIGPWVCGGTCSAVNTFVQNSESFMSFSNSVGLDSEQLGLRAGFLISALFPIMMLLGLIILSRIGSRKND